METKQHVNQKIEIKARTNPQIFKDQSGDPRIITRAKDAEEFKYAENWVNMYLEIFLTDRRFIEFAPKFYIKDLESEVLKLPEKDQKVLINYFGLKGGIENYKKEIAPNNMALINMREKSYDLLDNLRALASIYNFHKPTHEAVDEVAKKIYDPKGEYSDIEKAKYALAYYHYIYKYDKMWYEGSQEDVRREGERIVFNTADDITDVLRIFFKKFPEGDIILPMVKKFIFELDWDDEQFIKKQCQISNDKYYLAFFYQIRECKEHAFRHGKYVNGDYYRMSKIKKISTEKMRELCQVYVQYKENELKWTDTELFADEAEMNQFLHLVDWLYKNNTDFHGKPFSSYNYHELVKPKIK